MRQRKVNKETYIKVRHQMAALQSDTQIDIHVHSYVDCPGTKGKATCLSAWIVSH